MRLFFATLTLAGLSAQASGDGLPSGPITGVLVDNEQRSIRPILGMVPGAAYAGDPSVREMDFAVAAPDGRAALVARDGSLFVVRRLDGQLPVWRQLGEEKPGGPASWSFDGKALAHVTRDGGRVDFWRGVDGPEPELAGNVDLTYFSEKILALAVGPEGAYAFATARSDAGNALYLLKPSQMPRLILTLDRPGKMLLTGDELFVADRGRHEVLRLANWDFSMQVNTVATAGHGVADPVGIALSKDRKTLFVASAENQMLVAVDARSGGAGRTLELDFQPSRLESLAGGAYLLLDNGIPGESPAQVVDVRTMRVFYLPVRAFVSAAD
jgi:hypothetical protein